MICSVHKKMFTRTKNHFYCCSVFIDFFFSFDIQHKLHSKHWHRNHWKLIRLFDSYFTLNLVCMRVLILFVVFLFHFNFSLHFFSLILSIEHLTIQINIFDWIMIYFWSLILFNCENSVYVCKKPKKKSYKLIGWLKRLKRNEN